MKNKTNPVNKLFQYHLEYQKYSKNIYKAGRINLCGIH